MLSKKTQYAIYALVHLARQYDNGPVLISDIAQAEKLPRKFLESILLDLKTQGIVNSRKGKGGGYYLIKAPDQVHLADLIRNFDGALGMLPCVTFRYYESCNHCKDENTCGVRSVFKELRDHTASYLKNTTLQEILSRESRLQDALNETVNTNRE